MKCTSHKSTQNTHCYMELSGRIKNANCDTEKISLKMFATYVDCRFCFGSGFSITASEVGYKKNNMETGFSRKCFSFFPPPFE